MPAAIIDIPDTLISTSHKLDLLLIGTDNISKVNESRKLELVNNLQVRTNSFRLHLLCSDEGPTGVSRIAKEVWTKAIGKGVLHMMKRYNGEIPGFNKALLGIIDHRQIAEKLVPGMDLIIIVPNNDIADPDYERMPQPFIYYADSCEDHAKDWMVI